MFDIQFQAKSSFSLSFTTSKFLACVLWDIQLPSLSHKQGKLETKNFTTTLVKSLPMYMPEIKKLDMGDDVILGPYPYCSIHLWPYWNDNNYNYLLLLAHRVVGMKDCE